MSCDQNEFVVNALLGPWSWNVFYVNPNFLKPSNFHNASVYLFRIDFNFPCISVILFSHKRDSLPKWTPSAVTCDQNEFVVNALLGPWSWNVFYVNQKFLK